MRKCKNAIKCESEGLSNIPVQSPELFIHEVIKNIHII